MLKEMPPSTTTPQDTHQNGFLATSSSSSPIRDFYKDSKVFITGATGFLGRLLVEKLLRSCNPATVYVLVREKKGKDMEQRLRELFDSVVFDHLRSLKPNFHTKIVGVYGDCSKLQLGLNEHDLNMLVDNVTIVFHCAATVNFDEKLSMATMINIRGTREVLHLARKMKQLQFLTHVSTAYAHCHREVLKERFYESKCTADQLITIVENLPEDMLDRLETTIVSEFPNTYAFTKSISEQLIQKQSDLPVAVYRPAIIVSTYQEPIPGWINNFYGPQGVTAGAMVGLLRSLHCDETAYANIVPVDMCVNALISIPWDSRPKFDEYVENRVEDPTIEYDIPIYHYESNTYNPISWKEFRKWTKDLGTHCKTVKMIGIYFFHLRKNYYSHLLAVWFLHYLPAAFLDFILLCTGKKPKMIEAYKKIHKFSSVISYFCTRKWYFESRRVALLCDRMTDDDARDFFCDLRHFQWIKFFKTYLFGCRIYLIKDPAETLPRASEMYRRIEICTIVVVSLFMLLVFCLFYRMLQLF